MTKPKSPDAKNSQTSEVTKEQKFPVLSDAELLLFLQYERFYGFEQMAQSSETTSEELEMLTNQNYEANVRWAALANSRTEQRVIDSFIHNTNTISEKEQLAIIDRIIVTQDNYYI